MDFLKIFENFVDDVPSDLSNTKIVFDNEEDRIKIAKYLKKHGFDVFDYDTVISKNSNYSYDCFIWDKVFKSFSEAFKKSQSYRKSISYDDLPKFINSLDNNTNKMDKILDPKAVKIDFDNSDERDSVARKLKDLGYKIFNYDKIMSLTWIPDNIYCFTWNRMVGFFTQDIRTTSSPLVSISARSFLNALVKPNADDVVVNTSKIKYDVVGIPSGQVIYLTKQQFHFFESRKLIMFRDFVLVGKNKKVDLNNFCFKDSNLENITDLIDSITWTG